MNYEIVKENEQVKVTRGHNNKAPGLLRVFIVDAEQKLGPKMADIKKDLKFQTLISEYMQKPAGELLFRYNGNLGQEGKKGILIQDATKKFQDANANEITVVVSADVAEAPALAEAPAPEQPTQ